MIVGDPKLCGRCPHEPEKCEAIGENYLYCPTCRQIVCIAPRTRIPFKDRLTRELPRPRQDGFNQFEDQHLEF